MNWSNKLSECQVAECLTTTRETKQRQRGREHRYKWSERWNVRRVESLWFGVYVNWAEVRFRYKSNGAFCTFFFFFFFEFWLESSVSADTADSGPSRPDSAQIGPSRLKTRGIHVAWRRDAAGRVGNGIPSASLRPTASDAGAAPLVPHRCFIA